MKCTSVQEDLAWGKMLSSVDQEHVLNCPHCQSVALAFEEIDSKIKIEEIEIPLHFADSVMSKIHEREKVSLIRRIREIFELLSENQILRWGIGGTSFLIAFAAH